MATAFREIIEFMEKLGVYDIVLPFLLVFVVVFAILEKTKVFGTEKIDLKQNTQRNTLKITRNIQRDSMDMIG